MRSLPCLLASFQGCPTSEKSQRQKRHLAHAHLCQAARQTASLLGGGRQAQRSQLLGARSGSCRLSPHPLLQLWAAWGGQGEGAELGS